MSNYDFANAVSKDSLALVRKKELAQRLNVSVRTIHRMVERGEIKKPLISKKGYIRGWPEKDLYSLFLKT
ncbi:excisionase family DNA binding protein [Vibrio sp. ES.051]|uniref:helix-turn-helix transcriptional regulator n=1 Tax=Vibrio sp. ES.051 TaxID=1761909 RepID=UPI000BFA166E|nr:MerR family DNA-binding transcriptional regulator [Vibrio sp. ES.051]PFG45526.1 excisionase family DNA binding protein [Vibrio sp. ES.051]